MRTDDLWQQLRQFTQARIGLGRVGHSLPLDEVLKFQLAHAQARDAVVKPVDFSGIGERVRAAGMEIVEVRSRAGDRGTYLRRPDYGRSLDDDSVQRIKGIARPVQGYDLVLIVCDGLSAFAVENHSVPVLRLMQAYAAQNGWRVAPIVLVHQGRVAISDEIGAILGARAAAILIGERPGLSSPDSLGIYLTYGPRAGNVDSGRNCISNVRGGGLSCELAAHKLQYLLAEALRRRLSGVELKDDSDGVPVLTPPVAPVPPAA